jgi:uncharacterized protein (DUF1697 family)
MNSFVLLFRGINVGGNNLLPMKTLVTLLENNEYQEVTSYIQSGNVVLKSPHNSVNLIKELISKHFNFSPEILMIDNITFSTIVSQNPYTMYEGKFVHMYFCINEIALNTEKITQLLSPTEEYVVKGNVFYLHAPKGIGRSKLVANIEKCLNQVSTGRNLNTVNKINAMLHSI